MISKVNFSLACLIFVVLSNQAFGFSFSNCYGAKAYIKNEINQPIQFLYRSYVKRNLNKNGLDIHKEKEISINDPQLDLL